MIVVVCFATNVSPEQMGSKVVRLTESSIPLLPAYDKFMCGTDLTGQLLKSYAVDRKSKRCWLRIPYQSWNYAAYILLQEIQGEGKELSSFPCRIGSTASGRV